MQIPPLQILLFSIIIMLISLSCRRVSSATAFFATHRIRSVKTTTAHYHHYSALQTRRFSSPDPNINANGDINTNTNTNSNYSEDTRQRIEGLDATAEFSKLATKLKTPPKKLAKLLKGKLELNYKDPSSSTLEDLKKAEYLDFLLSGYQDASFPDPSSTAKPKQPQQKVPPPSKTASVKPAVATSSRAKPANSKQGGGEKQTFATDVLFSARDDLHPNSKKAVAEMGLVKMTEIQDRTFAAASSGSDVLGRARTGTGKTVAFLLPAIERLLQSGISNNDRIGMLVVSPTRELATQIGDQAEQLLAFHKGTSVQVMFGGTNMKRDITRLSQQLPTILVATPGRLLDHLQSTKINGRQRFGKDIMSNTPIVVLDETDRLLDMGFRKEITKILSYMPHPLERQTLLFSATIPPDLKVIMAQNMNKDFIEVDCINDGDAATQTNAQVLQSHVITPRDRAVSSVVEIVRKALEMESDTPAKIVVFFPTARLVNFYSELFNEGNFVSLPVLELHSKKSQAYRNRVSDNFRKIKRGILFTSDVSARGVDYPNVSHVIQFGMPESREQYIHRLGRTGRGGTEGKGWLVLSEWESLFLQELKGVDIPVDEDLRNMISSPIGQDSQELMEDVRSRIQGNDPVLAQSAKGAYQAFLGYYLGQMKRIKMKRKEDLVDIANDFAALSGLREPPALENRLVMKMGLKGIRGLNVGGSRDRDGGGSSNRSRGHNDGRRGSNSNAGSGGRRR